MKRILIVDDSLFMRTVLKGILAKMEGEYEIVEGASGDEALRHFERGSFDLVLLDIIMPEGEEEGVRVLETMMQKDPETKAIMISAVGQDLVMERCKRLGAKDYIMKPFDDREVMETVKRVIGD